MSGNQLTKKQELIRYFDNLALTRLSGKRSHSYYWNEITNYCNYFSNNTLSVLEIGCGTGELIASINGVRKLGIDFSPEMINTAKRKFPETEFMVMDAEELKLNEKFDLVIISNLIGFTSDIQNVFEEVQKVCHPETKIIVTYYNHLWEPLLKFFEMVGLKTPTPTQNWLTQADIKNLLFIAGFDVYRETKRMLFPVNIPLLSSFLNKFIATLPLIKFFTINNYSFAKQLFFLITISKIYRKMLYVIYIFQLFYFFFTPTNNYTIKF